MTPDDPRCPGCGQPLTRVAYHGVRYTCAACAGRLLGLRPFEQLLPDGEGARAWVASAAGETAAACPFCGHPMRAVPASAGGPGGVAGVAMCRVCEQVWVPAAAQAWLNEHATAPANTWAGALPPTECGECGAPWQPDDTGRCRFCRAQLTVPAIAVLIPAVRPQVLD